MATTDEGLREESRTGLIISFAVAFAFISGVSVYSRFYTRTRILRILGPDDVIIIIAHVFSVAVSVTTILEAVWGLGKHTQFVPKQDALRYLQCFYANIMIYNAAQILTKISFLIQYRKLFPSDLVRLICLWLLVFIAAWGLAQEFVVAFSCIPLTSILPHMADKCIYTLPVWYLTSAMNIVTDFLIFGIPVIPVIQLRISRSKKYLLLCLFCLGFFTCVISLVRLTTLHQGIHTTDPFWDNVPAAYWSVVELNCGILCACLPTLRPLFQKLAPRLQWTYRGSVEHGSANRLTSMRLRRVTEFDTDLEAGVHMRKEDEDFGLQSIATEELRESTIDEEFSDLTVPEVEDMGLKGWSAGMDLQP